jgi:hypothetical protein
MNKQTTVAATPTTTAASHVDAPQYSKRFQVTNGLQGMTLKLVNVVGPNEGRPPIGSTMTYGQEENFEVQYIAFGNGDVYATYQIWRSAYFMGEVEIHMVYSVSFQTRSEISRKDTSVPMHLSGSSTDAIIAPGNK